MPQPRTTIGDVARRAGVSKGTVSLAYSGKRPVSEQTRERIFAAAEELQWTPSQSARALATARTDAIGIVLARDPGVLATDAFFGRFIAGCESVLTQHNIALSLSVVQNREAEETTYRRLAAGRVDGVILLDVREDDHRFTLMHELQLPAVALTSGKPESSSTEGASIVHTDDIGPVAELVDALAELGHTRIAHVSGPLRFVHSRNRCGSFASAMMRRGLDPSLVVEGDFTAGAGRDATRQLLALPKPPTAITYGNDLMAIAGLSYARSLGLRIPEQLSLTGFDDDELAAHLSPPLTSVSTGAFERGVAVAEMLLNVLAGAPPATQFVDATRVLLRGSIARPYADESEAPALLSSDPIDRPHNEGVHR